jgi:hypothetical protein
MKRTIFEQISENVFLLKESAERDEMLRILKIDANDPKAPQKLIARMRGIGLGKTCGRCGGTGEYIYSKGGAATTGVCYQCEGKKRVGLDITPTNLEKARQLVTNGELEKYFDRVKKEAEAIKNFKSTYEAFFGVYSKYWKKLPPTYAKIGAGPEIIKTARKMDTPDVIYNHRLEMFKQWYSQQDYNFENLSLGMIPVASLETGSAYPGYTEIKSVCIK